MPKVLKDDLLQDEVRAVVRETGSFTAAASMLHISKVTLWRFHETGCAIMRTRLAIREALRRIKSETNFTENVTNSISQEADVQVTNLRTIRAFCQSMIALVDAYERVNRKGEPTPATAVAVHRRTASDDTQSGRRN